MILPLTLWERGVKQNVRTGNRVKDEVEVEVLLQVLDMHTVDLYDWCEWNI